MATPLQLTAEPRPDGTRQLTVVGEIDMSNANVLAEALEADSGKLVVDITRVDYLDSAGLAVLFTHAHRIEIIATSLLTPVLTISGLTALATVHTAGADE